MLDVLINLFFIFIFCREHPVFITWPEDVVKQVAEESRLQDYNSDEVIVRDSCKLHWIILITKVKV